MCPLMNMYEYVHAAAATVNFPVEGLIKEKSTFLYTLTVGHLSLAQLAWLARYKSLLFVSYFPF